MALTDDMRKMMSECHICRHSRAIPYNSHLQCMKPDPAMTGNVHGMKHGWFLYPFNFDPIWKTRLCANYEEAGE